MNNCPYLGLVGDTQTAAGFPSERNLCYIAKKPAPIPFSQQRENCLAGQHPACPHYQHAPRKSLPGSKHQPVSSLWVWVAWSLLAVAVLVGSLLFNRVLQPATLAVAQPVSIPSPAQPSAARLSETRLPAALPAPASVTPVHTLTVSQTTSPSDTVTISPQPMHVFKLDTPSGSAPELVIHRIAPGESIPMLADLNHTSSEAIQRINYGMPRPIWVGWVIVIPLNTQDISSLPIFETYQVKENNLTLNILAQKYGVNIETLTHFNQASAADLLPLDGWLLIPHTEQATPLGG